MHRFQQRVHSHKATQPSLRNQSATLHTKSKVKLHSQDTQSVRPQLKKIKIRILEVKVPENNNVFHLKRIHCSKSSALSMHVTTSALPAKSPGLLHVSVRLGGDGVHDLGAICSQLLPNTPVIHASKRLASSQVPSLAKYILYLCPPQKKPDLRTNL